MQTLNLSRNVSKFYVRQVLSLTTEQQSQNLLLKVNPLSTHNNRNNKLITQGKKTRNISQVESFCMEYIVDIRGTGFFS